MKTILKVIWGIFAVIGILSVILLINLRQKYGNFRLTVHPGYEARYDEFVDLLSVRLALLRRTRLPLK